MTISRLWLGIQGILSWGGKIKRVTAFEILILPERLTKRTNPIFTIPQIQMRLPWQIQSLSLK